jgi:hypothetical protein
MSSTRGVMFVTRSIVWFKHYTMEFFLFIYWRAPQQMLRTHPQPWRLIVRLCVMKMMKFFLHFHFNGAPVELNWQGKTEVLGEKPVPVPLRPPQIPHGPTRDRARASAVRGWRLTAWALARPYTMEYVNNFILFIHVPFAHPVLQLLCGFIAWCMSLVSEQVTTVFPVFKWSLHVIILAIFGKIGGLLERVWLLQMPFPLLCFEFINSRLSLF